MSLPELTRVRQCFPSEHVPDVADAVRQELEGSGVRVARGSRIAVAVGSRGITDLATVVREVLGWVRSQGGEPFLVPAMGSHGGATAEGQRQILEQYGLGEAQVGAAIHSSMEVVELDRGDVEIPVYFDAQAARADSTIVINRIKPHTSFHGRYESGLMKMLAIGLGKQRQAEAIHQLGVAGLRDCMPRVARQVIRQGNVLLGVAIVENAYDRTMRVRAIQAVAIPDEEPGLLELARANMPRLPVEDIDILVVDEMGKNISGLGIDPNIVGRLRIAGQCEPASPRIGLIVVRDLTEASAGNAVGMGLADVITRRLFEKIDWPSTYENVLTSTFVERGKVPLMADGDQQAMEFAMRVLRSRTPGDLRIVRIRNTLQLAELLVSPAVLKAIEGRSDIRVLGRAGPWFDQAGRMRPV